MRRYVVIGAGAVGGTIAGRLVRAGHEAVVVARGPHLSAVQRQGLHLRTPDFDEQIPVRAIGGPQELELNADDVLVLATKTHQAHAALAQWADARVEAGTRTLTAATALPVLTMMNGVAGERIALRYFDRVIGVCLWLPALHLHPGHVISRGTPNSGSLHMARYPAARSTTADAHLLTRIAADWGEAGFGVERPADVMPWKYHKLVSNIENAFHAVLGAEAWSEQGPAQDIITAAKDEARAVLQHAGIEVVGDDEEATVRHRAFRVAPVPGLPDTQLGSSSWQSLARGTGSIETDYLNGEIAMVARAHGVPAPINTAIAAMARRAAREGIGPGQVRAAALAAELNLS